MIFSSTIKAVQFVSKQIVSLAFIKSSYMNIRKMMLVFISVINAMGFLFGFATCKEFCSFFITLFKQLVKICFLFWHFQTVGFFPQCVNS